MTALAKVDPATGEITRFDPQAASVRVAVADVGMDRARKALDWSAFEEAARIKVAAMAEFVGWWQENVSVRLANRKPVAHMRPVAARDATAAYGIDKRTVSRWQKRLEDPDGYVCTLVEAAQRAANSNARENLELRRDRLIRETREQVAGRAAILHADCMTVVDDVPDIDLLLTDPPYFTDGDFTSHVSRYLAKVKPTGQAYVFASADPQEVAAYLAMDRAGMTLEQILVWNYNNTGQRQPKFRFNSNYQIAFYFRGPEAEALCKPSDGTHQYACQTVNAPDGRIGDRFHEWQKPLELIERYVRASSKTGDFVFDPFAGTGTTLIAAAKLGRRSLGCEVDERAIEIARQRGCSVGA